MKPMLTIKALFMMSLAAAEKDALAYEKPDDHDLLLAANDQAIDNFINEQAIPEVPNVLAEENILALETQAEALAKHFGSKNMHSVISRKLWEIIYNFIKENLEQFLKENRLQFKIYARYVFCFYVIPLLPTDYVLIFPSFYGKLIPSKFYKNEIVKTFIGALDSFFMRVRERSKRELLPAVTFARHTAIDEDLEMIKSIPEFIRSDPIR